MNIKYEKKFYVFKLNIYIFIVLKLFEMFLKELDVMVNCKDECFL